MSLTSISQTANVPSTYAPDLKPGGATPSAPVGGTAGLDQASLSATSALVAQAIHGSSSDVRTEKVSALQQAIGGGTYHVSSGAVAGKIIDSLTS